MPTPAAPAAARRRAARTSEREHGNGHDGRGDRDHEQASTSPVRNHDYNTTAEQPGDHEGRGRMSIEYVFAGLAVTGVDAAIDWYERLLGKPPDMRPNDREATWRLTETASVYIVADEDSGRARAQ